MTAHPPALPDSAFPALYRSADRLSLQGQRAFLRATKTRLVLAVVAAVSAAFSLRIGGGPVDVMAIAGAVAFAAVACLELYLAFRRPEAQWYDGRAVAESAKTLAWRYAVGASPFRIGAASAEEDVRAYYRDQLAELLHDAPSTSIAATTEAAVSEQLQAMRSRPFHERREAYLAGRIEDQRNWYASKSEYNRRRAGLWRIVLVTAEGSGILTAVLRAFDVFSVDLAGICAALVGSAAAWLAVKQHASLERAYAFAANELAITHSRLSDVQEEAVWAAEVADAEEAISREHTMWRASRSTDPG
ncbi:DUF4231 domain-containing protein [Actinomadura sp. NPDC000600]|uniref:DUF4231 domain-containing protein n=1 Tax=Actinomadura sp. NPDC000600 TaxID=3154262 RepID=UPI00339139D0